VGTGAVAPLKEGYEFIHRPRAVPLHRREAEHERLDLLRQGLITQHATICMLALRLGFFAA